MTPLLEVRDLDFSYPGGEPVLKGINLRLERGQRIGLRGRNGAGKTTLFHVIMGLEKPSAGKILLEGRAIDGPKTLALLRRKVGFLFQDADDQLFCPTLLEDVAFGPLNLGLCPADAREKALSVLELLGLSDLADRPPHTLSGGQKKLGALATILAMDPEALILDEPTDSLDDDARTRLERLLLGSDASLLVASHDSGFLSRVVPQSLLFRDGTLFPLT